MKLSIVIPCYNEKEALLDLVCLVKASPIEEKETILIDDGSTDLTKQLIESRIKRDVDKVIYHPRNLGKGAAIKSGLKHVTGDLVIIQDADLEYDPREYPKLMAPIIEHKADVVYGSRFLRKGSKGARSLWHYVGNRFLTLLSNKFTHLNLTDMETCYKLFKTEIIRGLDIEENGFGVEPEITAKIAKQGLRIQEVEISYNGRSYGQGKKAGWTDGLEAVYCIIKYGLFA